MFKNLEQLILMVQKIQKTITQGRKLPTSDMHSDLCISGTAIYMNPYQIYMPNKPVDPLKCYRELLGLLTTKFTNKLSSVANIINSQQYHTQNLAGKISSQRVCHQDYLGVWVLDPINLDNSS
jgi:hypothetical protein